MTKMFKDYRLAERVARASESDKQRKKKTKRDFGNSGMSKIAPRFVV